jgi:hypothetical protein
MKTSGAAKALRPPAAKAVKTLGAALKTGGRGSAKAMKARAARSAVESRGPAGLEAGRRRRAKAVNAPTAGNAVERRNTAALRAGVSRRASGAGPAPTRAARAKMTIGGSAPL